MRLILDTGVLGRVVHPRKHADAKAWLGAVGSHDVLVSEVCDYELRRELIRIGAQRRSIASTSWSASFAMCP